MIIYGDKQSGNCYKVQLLCANLGLTYQWQDVDILKQQCQSPAFMAKNPNGKIPIIELDNGQILTESNAILYFLAQNTPLFPDNAFSQAKVLQWQCFEQYSHEPYIAVARFIKFYQKMPSSRLKEFEQKVEGGYKALDIMDNHLGAQGYFVGNQYSIADISLYAYTHVAYQGGFDLGNYPNINAWFNRIEKQPGYIAMQCE